MKSIFLEIMGGRTSQPKLKKYRDMKDYTDSQMIDWLKSNLTYEQTVNMLAYYILEDLNDVHVPKITITQEQFDALFHIRKAQANPMRDKLLSDVDSPKYGNQK